MDIKYSRRILILGAREAGALEVVKDLTGSAPEPDVNGSTAGLTHEWNVDTTYYKAKVPIWVDEVTDIQAWKDEFSKPEAKEVVDAVGAWIFCFRREADGQITESVQHAMKSIQDVVDEHSCGADAVLLAVAKPANKQTKVESRGVGNHEEQDDRCMEYGFEYIDYAACGTNEFGEKLGLARLKEALEANDWDAGDEGELDLAGLDFDGDEDYDAFGQEEVEMTAELFGMKAALGEDEELDPAVEDFMPPQQQAGQVEGLDRMMSKLLAVKEQSAELPEAQRKRMAAKAVRELMKENRDV